MNLSANSIDASLRQAKVIVTCGTGGVGKTTLSAALAIRACMLGRKVLVITMDPAKRLATSLGIDLHPGQMHEVTSALHLGAAPGQLFALMPDTREAFEEFFRSISPTPQVADKIIQSPIFQILARDFSGANEYMALKKLNQIAQTQTYDLIVLDTPPSRSTLQFFAAPQTLSRFFEEKWFRILVNPANRLMASTLNKAIGLLEKLTGRGFVIKLLEFVSALFETEKGFRQTLSESTTLLRSPTTEFFLVASPSPEMAPEIHSFIRSIGQYSFHFSGILFNRALSGIPAGDRPVPENKKNAMEILIELQKKEGWVKAEFGDKVLKTMPELVRDVHGLGDLIHVAKLLG